MPQPAKKVCEKLLQDENGETSASSTSQNILKQSWGNRIRLYLHTTWTYAYIYPRTRGKSLLLARLSIAYTMVFRLVV